MIEDIKTGLKLVVGVVDLAKNIQTLSTQSTNIDLQEAATELRSKTIDLKKTVNEMSDRIIDLEKQLEFKEKLDWNGKTFEYEQNGKKIYICNGCEANGKFTHMSEQNNGSGYHAAQCPVCKNNPVFDYGVQLNVNPYDDALD